jgi:hypothetical protein
MAQELFLGQIVEMKKVHPCGSTKWKIIRLGADIKIQCMNCNRVVMLDRLKFLKSVKKFEVKEGEGI